MIIGNPSNFAIESEITQAYSQLSHRALGFFVIHVAGRQYGVRATDATMLALSYDQVRNRLAHRGKHIAPFASNPGAGKIADAFSEAIYIETTRNDYFGFTSEQFVHFFAVNNPNNLIWAPDGDEAFDDSSYILQFDIGDQVRLIAFQRPTSFHDPATLKDLWLGADNFYSVLNEWSNAFLAEWESLPKLNS